MPKKVLIALPPAMLEQVDYIAQCEHRTRSDMIREALRRYLIEFRKQNAPMPTGVQRGGIHGGPVSTRPMPEDFDEFRKDFLQDQQHQG